MNLGMRASTQVRIQSWLIRRARAGVDSPDWLKRAGDIAAARTVDASPRRSRASADGGGVLEHPAHSDAWPAFGLPQPTRNGGWQRGMCGGWSCQVEQWHYGHRAKKATWLYAHGTALPPLRWGFRPDHRAGAIVSWCGNHSRSDDKRPRLSKAERSRTPVEFRDALLAIARSARGTLLEAV